MTLSTTSVSNRPKSSLSAVRSSCGKIRHTANAVQNAVEIFGFERNRSSAWIKLRTVENNSR